MHLVGKPSEALLEKMGSDEVFTFCWFGFMNLG